jgi:hypothetical protein
VVSRVDIIYLMRRCLLKRLDVFLSFGESIAMLTIDNVLVTVPQIVEQFDLSAGVVRSWIAAGLLKPVRREGRGRSGTMYFARGEVGSLVYGICPACGGGFKKAAIDQAFCSRLCRDRSRRLHAHA